MKIRNGFVSNSSSSSFVISDKRFPKIKDLAIYMLKKKEENYIDYDYEDKEWNKSVVESTKKQINILDSLDEDQPISFPSTNYDTYIRKVGDMYLVSTCNNIRWGLSKYSISSLSDSAIEDLKEIAEQYKNEEEDPYDDRDYDKILDILEENLYEFYHFGNDFFDLNTEIIGVETYDNCPNEKIIEHGENYHLWDTQKHGKICLVCNKAWKRKEKLNKIINSKN